MLRRRWPVVPFVAWTAFVWVTRISNAWNDATASTQVKVGATVLSVAMLAVAGAVVAVTIRAARRPFTGAEVGLLRGAALVTWVVWAVRAAQIALADYSGDPNIPNPAGFKAVHLVLGVVSAVLAALVWRVAGRDGADRSPAAEDDAAAPPAPGVAAPSAVSPAARAGR